MRPAQENSSGNPAFMDTGDDAMKVAIVGALFHGKLIDQMMRDTIDTLTHLGVPADNIHSQRVPGSLELPVAANLLAESKKYQGVIALGVVIRGETPHFDYVCQGTVQGLVEVSTRTSVPIMFGVLTTDTLEQAVARIEGPVERKGEDVARGVVHMINLARQCGR